MGDGESVDGEGCQGKAELRRRAIAMRLRTTRDDRLRQGQAVVRAFAASGVAVRTGDVVAAYVSMGSEVDTRPLLSRLLATGCTVLVPRLGGGLDIGWSELESLKSLSNVGAGRPWEPSDGAVLPPGTLGRASLILVPALAVDARGTRLGRGGGWYDRALAVRRPGTPIVAVCWPWENRVADGERGLLPALVHDVPVDAVLTGEGLTWTGRMHCPAND